MKKFIFITLFFLLTICYAEVSIFPKKYYIELTDYLYLNENGIGHFTDLGGTKSEFNYKYEIINGLLFIYIEEPGFLFGSRYINKLMILEGFSSSDIEYKSGDMNFGFCNLKNRYDEASELICPTLGGYEITHSIFKDCTSFLIEKNKQYPAENMNKIDMDTPWVENVPGYGIGEGFTIIDDTNHKYSNLLLINGYISYDKPYLYSQNGRVKKLKITGCDSGVSKVLEVLDTPHPQSIDISFLPESDDIRVEIAEVYPGTKYEDTCIHYCVPWDGKVTPIFDKPINQPMSK